MIGFDAHFSQRNLLAQRDLLATYREDVSSLSSLWLPWSLCSKNLIS
jgi:hypothetical protein